MRRGKPTGAKVRCYPQPRLFLSRGTNTGLLEDASSHTCLLAATSRVPRKCYAGQNETRGSLCPVCRGCVWGELCGRGDPAPPLPSPHLPRPLLPCIHCRSGPRFSSPRHTSFEGRRTSLSRTLKAGARFDQPAVPRCCPHFYPNNINKPPRPDPAASGGLPAAQVLTRGASACGPAWVRWGGEAATPSRGKWPRNTASTWETPPWGQVRTACAVGPVAPWRWPQRGLAPGEWP